MEIILNHIPISNKRPRHCTRGKITWTYDPQVKEKLNVRATLRNIRQVSKESLYFGPSRGYEVELTFNMPIENKCSQKSRNEKLSHSVPYTKKPDLDNLEKFYLDCCSGIFFPDDRYVVSLKSKKQYSDIPSVIIKITEFYGNVKKGELS